MARPIPIVALAMAEAAFAVLEAECPDLDYELEALEEMTRMMRVQVRPRVAERDFASKPKW